jgi:isoquinoline 1-oxidoreductase
MAVIDVRAALRDDGGLAAWDFHTINAGAAGIANPYRVADWRLRYSPSDSPIAQGSYRALATTANNFARESHIDDLARVAGTDPAQFRFAHLEDTRLAAVLDATLQRLGGLQPGRGIAIGTEKQGRVATGAEIEIDADGGIRVTRLVTSYECGAVVNPDTVRNQVEGATVMALGGAMFEALDIDRGRFVRPTLHGYRMPRFSDVPELDVAIIDRPEHPPAGAGETPVVAVAPAIANAICSATGERRRSLPLLGSGVSGQEP